MIDASANSAQSQSADEQFFAAAYQRIVRIMLALVPCLVILFWIFFNHRFAIGFLAGGGSLERLRMYVGVELPRHMQPARFELRDALPRLPSGKHDLAALHS